MATLFATCALGTEDLVEGELQRLGAAGVKRASGGVRFGAKDGGEFALAMRACLHLRSAMRVLWPLGAFPAPDAEALYEGASRIAWERWLTVKSTFAISATTRAEPPMAHGPFLGQKLKDAVVDRLRAKLGARPDVDRDDPDVRLYIHIGPAARGKGGLPEATVGLDVSGESLHARGYRVAQVEAPLRESLAAACVLATDWVPEQPFVDPLCGSGTIAIEAALRVCKIAPALATNRRGPFGFERWPTFGDAERATLRALIDEARAAQLARAPAPIIGADRDPSAIDAARANARACVPAVAASIEWRVADARELEPTVPPATIVSNLPYGERIGPQTDRAQEGFLRSLGGHFRTLDGHTAYLLAPPEFTRLLGLRASHERNLMNGPIPVVLTRFDLGRQRLGRR